MRRREMRTPWLVATVAVVHCVAVAMIVLIQGCGRTVKPAIGTPPEPVMPPPVVVDTPAETPKSPHKTTPSQRGLQGKKDKSIEDLDSPQPTETASQYTSVEDLGASLSKFRHTDITDPGTQTLCPFTTDHIAIAMKKFVT